jgi:UPF0755 protein
MKKLFIVFVLFLILIAGGVIWWKNGVAASDPNNKSSKIFVIRSGEQFREVANDLKKQNLIKDPIVFFLLSKYRLGIDKKIEAGDFRLSPSMSAYDVATNLTHGTLDIWVTIPEGNRSDEIADTLSRKIPNYSTTWRGILDSNEGYLFPDTYLIPRDADINLIVSLMKANFNNKFAYVQSSKTSNLTDSQAVILASMIEREAKFPQDRPLVASVILNRLAQSMPLQIDATVQYVLGYQQDTKTWWKKNLTSQDLKINSPYNTRINVGLPPAPISNPGLSALQASMNPANTNYLYYCSDKTGHLHFSETLQGHNDNIVKYGC